MGVSLDAITRELTRRPRRDAGQLALYYDRIASFALAHLPVSRLYIPSWSLSWRRTSFVSSRHLTGSRH